ncbi:MAG: glycosyl transferase family 51 [Alphaproteobacteria bacterium]|nr:glycosyl transferase family 51 [Alphaproteobacteria bacterium]
MGRTLLFGAFAGAVVTGAAYAVSIEMDTFEVQTRVFTKLARGMGFTIEPGANPDPLYPTAGPYDERLGYAHLPSALETLADRDYEVEQQARMSPELASFVRKGGFAIYHEKTRAGLLLRDRFGGRMFESRYPERTYADFPSIPQLVVDSLLFIENRELLDDEAPNRNPAIEGDRFAAAVLSAAVKAVSRDGRVAGASTLATQMEKYRHSPGGQTVDSAEKVRQMISASVRAYQDGPDTTATRRRIVVDYLNSTPLSARPGFGEVIGLGDGLYAWYGTDFDAANAILRREANDPVTLQLKAGVFKQVLSLLLAQRRPSGYLIGERAALRDLTDSHIRVLRAGGLIDDRLAEAALAIDLKFREDPPLNEAAAFVNRKAETMLRAHLLGLLGVDSFYRLDRFDLTAASTIDALAQERVTEALKRLADPEHVRQQGLVGDRLLRRGDPANVTYSVAIYERGRNANHLRLQTDNSDRPLDINDGSRIDLGSTAKLRTLVTYLEVVAEIYERHRDRTPAQLRSLQGEKRDPLTRWTIQLLVERGDPGLLAVLEAAMERRYSASTVERFFTGGGVHAFNNFDRKHDGDVMPVREAFRHSVNLVFVRMMRDVIAFYSGEEIAANGEGPSDAESEEDMRRAYLELFADQEGREFLNRFYQSYRGRNPDQVLDLLASRVKPTGPRLATAFRSVRPEAGFDAFVAFMKKKLPAPLKDEDDYVTLFERYGVDRFNLHDRGYIARIHPLELWLAAFLQTHPQATRTEVMNASEDERQEAYAWIFKTRHRRAQDKRIRIIREQEAFEHLHEAWQRVGYPFENLTPSYATSIGSSGDRPSALADLMGLIANDGVRLPTHRVTRLHFAAGTPYETVVVPSPGEVERIFAPEVAQVLRRALADVVQNGTARRVAGSFTDAEGHKLAIGGKTGTGDHRQKRVVVGGKVFEAKVVSRAAAFVFYIGDCFYGTLTAFVQGPEAGQYEFTSALPTQVLKSIAPALKPMIERSRVEQGPGGPVCTTTELREAAVRE